MRDTFGVSLQSVSYDNFSVRGTSDDEVSYFNSVE